MDYQLIGARGTDIPRGMSGPTGQVGQILPDDVVLFTFPSYSHDAAVGILLTCQKAGIRVTLGEKHGRDHVGKWWTPTGSPGSLVKASQKLGVPMSAIFKAEQEGPVRQINTRIGACYERYKQVKGPTKENREFTPIELKATAGLLDACNVEDARLHAMAAASRSMIEEARTAFGLPPGEYHYHVITDFPKPDPTVILVDAAELTRLKAEHAELLEQNKALVAMVEQLRTPAAQPEAVVPPKPADPIAYPEFQSPRPAPPRPLHHKGR